MWQFVGIEFRQVVNFGRIVVQDFRNPTRLLAFTFGITLLVFLNTGCAPVSTNDAASENQETVDTMNGDDQPAEQPIVIENESQDVVEQPKPDPEPEPEATEDDVDGQAPTPELTCPEGFVPSMNAVGICCQPGFPWFLESAGFCSAIDPSICPTQIDGICDDGRPGAVTSICPLGTDIDDCIGVVPPPPLDPDPIFILPLNAILVSYDGEFLGNINDNAFDSDSLANDFGTYGNTFGSLSIWNEFGTFGNEFSSSSPWNEFTTTPPAIFVGDEFFACLTANEFACGGDVVHPNTIAIEIGRLDVLR